MISFNAKKLLILGITAVLAKNVYTPVLVRCDSAMEQSFARSVDVPEQGQ